jgi:hypothetical protein
MGDGIHVADVARNWLPSPCPALAPRTRPAMSINFRLEGTILPEFSILARTSSLSSGTGTMPVLGSMVQKGKLAASAPPLHKALKSVDLPTLGKPTKPQEKLMFGFFL